MVTKFKSYSTTTIIGPPEPKVERMLPVRGYHNEVIPEGFRWTVPLTEYSNLGPTPKCTSCQEYFLAYADEWRSGCNHLIHLACGKTMNYRTTTKQSACGHCQYCCQCVNCVQCNTIFDMKVASNQGKYHHLCLMCKKCCACRECDVCTKIASKSELCVCLEGDPHHAYCCASDARINDFASGHELLYINRRVKFHEADGFKLSRTRRMMAIESEVDHVPKGNPSWYASLMRYTRKWGSSIVTDQSFTCPPGFEINTSPSNGDSFITQVKELAAIYEAGAVKASFQTGMHVHIDARDFRYPDLINFINVYAKVEFALFAALPPWRRLSKYATPCAKTLLQAAAGGFLKTLQEPSKKGKEPIMKAKPSIALALTRRIYGESSTRKLKGHHDPKRAVAQEIRYNALNIHAWFRMKTFEFRHYPGNVDLNEMMMWPQVLATVVEYAKRTPLKTIMALPVNPREALAEILKPASWKTKGLNDFVQSLISKWSPDYDIIWKECVKNNDVIPFVRRTQTHVIGFDAGAKYYTYLHHSKYGGRESNLWYPPAAGLSYYATQFELINPNMEGVAWMAPPELLKVSAQKEKVQPSSQNSIGLQMDHTTREWISSNFQYEVVGSNSQYEVVTPRENEDDDIFDPPEDDDIDLD